MNNYSIALFLHVVGALGFFLVLGLEWIALLQIRIATLPEEVRAILGVLKRTDRLGLVSVLTTIISGIYMMLTVWGWVPWILVVLGAFVLESILFVVFAMPRMAAIDQALATEKATISQTFQNLVNHPLLWISIQTRVAIVLGIILLKFTKPDLGGSLLTIGVAIILGLASALPVLGRERAQVGSAD